MLIVDGDRGSIGFEGEMAADIARRHAVAVAVERQSEIFVDQSFGGIAIVGHDHGQSRRVSG